MRKPFPVALLLAVSAVFGTYANHFRNVFHFDDSHTIVDNPYIRSLGNVSKFFTDARTFSILPANRTYRPVVSTSLAVDYFFAHGNSMVPYHVSTFLWFLLQLVAVYLLALAVFNAARVSTGNRYVALFAALVYGLHPANAETVNYIIQRGDLYSTLGVVAGLAMYIWRPQWRKTGAYLVPVCFGVLSKPPALVFPALLLLYILYFEAQSPKLRVGAALLKVFPALILCGLLAWLQAAMTPKTYLPAVVSAYSYRITQPYVWMRYFASFFLPVHLSADTDLAPFPGVNGQVILGFLFFLALAASAFGAARKQLLRPISFGLIWFVLALLPTSLYTLSEVENDHRMFFAFIGLTLAASWGAALAARAVTARWSVPSRRAVYITAALAICSFSAYGTIRRNQVWRTEESLWRDVTEKSPKNGRGWMNYGLTQMGKGNYVRALALFNRAAELVQNYPTLEVNLGIVNGCLGQKIAAQYHFERAVSLAPADAQTHFFYGRWLLGDARVAEARNQLRTAVNLNPDWPASRSLLLQAESEASVQAKAIAHPLTATDYLNQSLALHQAHQYMECIAAARKALQLQSKFPEAYNNIAAAYEELHLWDDAISAARAALKVKPDYVLARNNLLWALQQKRTGTR